ncbi:MAG: hypothetical protein RMJ54_19015, partial [Roseiflexaceae bacterium]|nr:hypothetical protein [Roseiflexaceae bacterium]
RHAPAAVQRPAAPPCPRCDAPPKLRVGARRCRAPGNDGAMHRRREYDTMHIERGKMETHPTLEVCAADRFLPSHLSGARVRASSKDATRPQGS